jgi:hypothetical protein
MNHWLSLPSVRIALLVGSSALVARYLGLIAFISSLPIFAALAARPLMALASTVRQKLREHVWLGLQGRHYVYRQVWIRVLEDDERNRWICLDDVRRVVPSIADDPALAVTYADRFEVMGKSAMAHLRDDALVLHLSKQGNLASLKFRTWVERAIVLPAQKTRANLAIDVAAASQAGKKR